MNHSLRLLEAGCRHAHRRVLWIILTLIMLAVLCACFATQPGRVADLLPGERPGFLLGFWHGFIAPIAFVVSLFSEIVHVYAYPNNGGWYEFGFMLGISGFSGGIFAGSRSKKRKKD